MSSYVEVVPIARWIIGPFPGAVGIRIHGRAGTPFSPALRTRHVAGDRNPTKYWKSAAGQASVAVTVSRTGSDTTEMGTS